MSFLDKLKKKVDVIEENKINNEAAEKQEKEAVSSSNSIELDIDIFETPDKFLIIGDICGVDVKSLDISIGEENDVLVIQGRKVSPVENFKTTEKKIAHHHQECRWGDFYRQIILPQEVNPEEIVAYEERGALVIILPMLRLKKGKKNIKVNFKD